MQDDVKKCGCLLVDDILLEGHIGITKELIKCLAPEKKFYYGSDESSSINLVKVSVFSMTYLLSKLARISLFYYYCWC